MSDKDLPSLDELGESIKKAQKKASGGSNSQDIGGAALAGRIISDLVAGMALGAILGYYMDVWFDTSPVFFILCFFFGFAASMLNIYRLIANKNNEQ